MGLLGKLVESGLYGLKNGVMSIKEKADKTLLDKSEMNTGRITVGGQHTNPKTIPLVILAVGSIIVLPFAYYKFTAGDDIGKRFENVKHDYETDNAIKTPRADALTSQMDIDKEIKEAKAALGYDSNSRLTRRPGDSDNSSLTSQADSQRSPNANICSVVLKKIKTVETLTQEEKNAANECIDKSSLSEEEKRVAKQAAATDDPNVREAISQYFNPNATEEQKAAALKIAEAKERGVRDSDLQQLASAVNNNDQNAMSSALGVVDSKISSMPPVVNYKNQAQIDKLNPNQGQRGNNGLESIGASSDEINAKAKQLADLSSRLDRGRSELDEYKRLLKEAMDKINKGQEPTDRQAKAVTDFQKKAAEVKELEMAVATTRDRLAKDAVKMQNSIALVSSVIDSTESSATFLYTEKAPDCKKTAKIKVAKKSTGSNKAGPVVSKADRELEIYRKKFKDEIDARRALMGGTDDVRSADRISSREIFGDGRNQSGERVAFNYDNKTGVELAPDLKIAAVLSQNVIALSTSPSVIISAKVLHDVFDINGKIVIPLGSYVRCKGGSVVETEAALKAKCEFASVGGKKVPVALVAYSGEGSEGITGKVKDTRTNKIWGLFLTSFSQGVISWFSTVYAAQYQNGQKISDALAGSALSGAADSASKLSEMVINDIQSAPIVFYAPRGTTLLLIPE